MIPRRASIVAPAALLASAAFTLALADPDEAWLHRAELPADVHPLLVLLMDTSAAAARTILAPPAYEPAQDYAALVPTALRCDPARVYWRRGPGPAPDCPSQAGLDPAANATRRAFACEGARASLARQGFFIASRAAQWHDDAMDGRWAALEDGATGPVECRVDRALHGASPGAWYAADGRHGPWSGNAADEIRWDRAPHADPYVFYVGNYLNYLRADLPLREFGVTELARQSLAGALRASDSIDAALLRPAEDANGGYVARASAPATTVAADLEALAAGAPAAGAPLAELLSEAAAWLAGGPVRFGRTDSVDALAFDASSGQYASPYVHSCRPVTIAYATAGVVAGDESAADAAAALPGFLEATGGCDTDCLAALSRFVAGTDLRGEQPGRQSAPVHWLTSAPAAPEITAAAGGTGLARVDDPHAYVNLLAQAHQRDAAVPAGPALSSAGLLAASTTTHEPAVIYGLTAPRARQRWLGNLFRYGLRPPESPLAPPAIVDRDGEAAIDNVSGLPLPGSRSAWSDAPDSSLLAGAAAGRLPAPSERHVYVDLAVPSVTDARNRLVPDDPRVDRFMVGLAAADRESPGDVIEWLLASRPLGDPGLHAPLVVNYREQDLAVAYVATHDGLLHAVDAATGVERWAWMPRNLMSRLAGLMRDEETTARSHGIDGPLVVHRFDPDGDGRIAAARGEHLWLLFGLGRGGNAWFALDIAEPDAPRLLWTFSLPDADEVDIRPEPVVARLGTGDPGQSGGGWIVLLAGGRGLHVLDAETGRPLWSAAAHDDAIQRVPGLTEILASAPRAIDLDGDGRIDRAYLLDSVGGLWRFDFTPDSTPAELAAARRIARFGDGSHSFHASPDVSIARLRGQNEIAIAAGSGRLDRPRDAFGVDRIYVVFDRDHPAELSESGLHDATDRGSAMPATAPGWYLRLERHGAGEKIIGPALTFDHVLRFQTYQPLPQERDAPCGPPRALRRLYARDIRTGLPATNVERPDEDEEVAIESPGLPVELRYAFPRPMEATCAGCRARPFGILGTEIFDPGYAGDPVRTSWRKLPLPDSR